MENCSPRILLAVRTLALAMARFDEHAARALGVNRSDLAALLLMESDDATPTEIAQHLNLTSGSVSSLIRRLEQADLVTTRASEQDKRSTVVSLRDETRERIRQCFAQGRESSIELEARFSEEELTAGLSLMAAIAEKIDSARSEDMT